MLEWIAGSHPSCLIAIVLVSLICFLPGQTTIPAVDRDEARYVQATTQMLETGDIVDIRLHDRPRHFQPAGIYWLQALAVKLTGAAVPAPISVYRLPSLAAACLVALLVYWAALPLGDRKIALVAAMMMAACLLLNVEARLAKTDAVLNAAIVACQAVLLRLYLRGEKRPPLSWAFIFWIAAAIGILVKGPILPLVTGATVLAASLVARDVDWLRGLRPLVGVPLMLVIALPWYVAIWFATDGAFFATAISYNVTGKITTGMQSHGAPPGYYLLLFSVTAWPIAAVFVAALPALWRERRTAFICFIAAWVLPVWIVYELIATKLPHYVLPLYPAVALAAAMALGRNMMDAERRWVRAVFGLAALGPVLFVAAAAFALHRVEGVLPGAVIVLGLATGLAGIASLSLARRGALLPAWLILAVAAAPLAYATLFGAVAPQLRSLWLSPQLAAAALDAAGCRDPEVFSVGNNEASLIFAVGTGIRFGGGEKAAEFLAEGGCRAAIVESAGEAAFMAELKARSLFRPAQRRVSGINIANGRFLDFGVYGAPSD